MRQEVGIYGIIGKHKHKHKLGKKKNVHCIDERSAARSVGRELHRSARTEAELIASHVRGTDLSYSWVNKTQNSLST